MIIASFSSFPAIDSHLIPASSFVQRKFRKLNTFYLNMFIDNFKTDYTKPIFLFSAGLCLVLLSGWVPVFPNLHTFIHLWRVELAASVFLLVSFFYLLFLQKDKKFFLCFSRQEVFFIVLPLLAFITWSGLSIVWAPSWKSALYHTLTWSVYLIFYLFVRHILNLHNGYKFLISLISTAFLIICIPAIIEYCAFTLFGGATTLGIRYAKYGEQINIALPLIIIGAFCLNGKRFAISLFIITVVWLFTVSTFSRTSFLLFIFILGAIACLIFLFKRFRQYRSKLGLLILALVLSFISLHFVSLFSPKPDAPILNRFTDNQAFADSSNFRKLMALISVEMFKANPLIGVGAGNFGMQFNNYRASYAEKNPSDINLATAENELAERSHNEYLQILAELGIVGGLIFLWFLIGIGMLSLKGLRKINRNSLFPTAALLGIAVFLASSMVTSYSFRLIQNGFVFFFVLAFAVKFLLPFRNSEKSSSKINIPFKSLQFGYAFGIAVCVMFTGLCLLRVTSAYYANQAYNQSDIEQAMRLCRIAIQIDDENANANFACGMNLIHASRYSESVPQFARAIELGRGTSADFSYLATAQTLSGDTNGAEKTFFEATRLYPLSPFVHTRYASLLKANGKHTEAIEKFNYAFSLNQKQSNTWWTFINSGSKAATQQAFENSNCVPLMDLRPTNSIYAVLTEREIKFPSEKVELNFGD